MTHSEGDAILSRRGKGITVQASPFNAVKLDLALIVIVGIVVLVVHDRLLENQLGQLAMVVGYGVVAMLWIVIRTRRVLRSLDHALDSSQAESDAGRSSETN